MNVPFNQFFKYLFNHKNDVHINYVEERYSGDIRVTSFLKDEEYNDSSNDNAYENFLSDITAEVRDHLRKSNLYRMVAVTFLLLLVFAPALLLFFLNDNTLVVFGAFYYIFFAYLLVEAYIQSDRNYFEDYLYEKLQKEYMNN